jgi:pyruvate/2-oxoglutarate dehydrogenase complex dihydrolipoamide dehydrogenase (E3) component
MQAHKSDVIIVGSGQAAVPLATRLAAAGRRVIFIERAELGGTCVNSGCTPTKTLIASARAAHVARSGARLGVHAGEVRVDFAAVMARKDAVLERSHTSLAARLGHFPERIRRVRGQARFVGERTLAVGDERFSADTIVLNVGARARVPDIAGMGSVPFLDNKSILALRTLPAHLVILGAGYIGCEMAQMFRRFGSAVTLIDHHEQLLSREDPEIATALEDVFRGEGIELVLGARSDSVRSERGDVVVRLASGRELRGSHLLVAVGRRPNTDELDCKSGGVDLDARGFVIVGEDYATSAPGVFAVGDVTGGPQFTHTSWDDHRVLFNRLVGKPARPRSQRIVPFCVFVDPQIAGVGLNEREAKQRGLAYERATMPFGDIARAVETDERAGTMKLLVDARDQRLLGCRLMGAEAGELIHIFVVLMQADASLRAIVDAECVHPTFAEGVQSLVMRLPEYALS